MSKLSTGSVRPTSSRENIWSGSGAISLTLILLVLWRLHQLDELHINVKLHTEKQSDLQEHELELPDACQTQPEQEPLASQSRKHCITYKNTNQ